VIFFVQFYSKIRNPASYDIGNGFSDTYDLCKNMGEFLWIKHKVRNFRRKDYTKFPISNANIVYVSAIYLTHLWEVYNWAKDMPNALFIVGGPALKNVVIKDKLPPNMIIKTGSVEQLFGVPDFSNKWNLDIPPISKNQTINFSYTLSNKCYWGKCIFCSLNDSEYRKRDRFNFKDIKWSGKKIIRLSTDAMVPDSIINILPNLPYVDNLKYWRSQVRASEKELKTFKQILPIEQPMFFSIGLEFPSTKMWKYMKKGYNKDIVLELVNLLIDHNMLKNLNIILGWDCLDNNDLYELQEFMNSIKPSREVTICMYNLFAFCNTSLHNYLDEERIEEKIEMGPFYCGFKIKTKNKQLNKRIDNAIKQICREKSFTLWHL
jgi:hypothetical protein